MKCGIARDVTERKRAEEEIRQRTAQLEALREISLAITAQLELDALLQTVVEQGCRLLDVRAGGVYLVDEMGDNLQLVVSQGYTRDYTGTRLTPGEGLAGKVLQSGEPLAVDDYHHWEERSPDWEAEPLTAVLGIPLKRGEQVIGVLNFGGIAQARSFDEHDLWLATLFATQAAIAIENARLFRQTQAQLRELSALQKTITTLQSSLELQEVLDRIAQAVVTGLGYHIALLAEYEEGTNALTTRAVAADPSLVGAVEAISGMKAMGVSITLDQTENLGVRAALAREIAVTQCLDDLFRPVVSAEISEAIQELAGVKSMVTIPFFTKGRLVGNMFAGTDKEAITEAEIDSLESSLVRRPSPSRTPGFSKRRPGSEKRPKPCARRPWP